MKKILRPPSTKLRTSRSGQAIIKLLVKKQKEISSLPQPNSIGSLTPIYRRYITYFKTGPYKILIPLALLMAIVIYFLFNVRLVNLVTLLQNGF